MARQGENHGKTVPDTDARNIPDADARNIPDTDGRNIPDTDGRNIPDTDARNIPDADGKTGPGYGIDRVHGMILDSILASSRSILELRPFKETARRIFDEACSLTGARSGYVALLSEDGEENEVVFLESGGLACSVDPGLPMPIRGLRGEAYRLGRAVRDNSFSTSEWADFMPKGHVRLDNVLFAPLNIGGRVVGIMGLANKKLPFTEEDSSVAALLGEIAAVALQVNRTLQEKPLSEERYRTIMDVSLDGIAVMDSDSWEVLLTNKALRRILGLDESDGTGLTIQDFIKDEDIPRLQAALSEPGDMARSRVKAVRIRGHDGVVRYANVNSTRFDMVGRSCILSFFNDITERKRDSLLMEQMNEELMRSNRELEDFAYVVSHDLQAPIRQVMNFSGLLASKYGSSLDEKATRYMTNIDKSARRMQGLLNALLEYSRVGTRGEDFVEVDMPRLINGVLEVLEPRLDETGGSVVVTGELPSPSADVNQMSQLFMNLIDNALKFTGETTPTISISGHVEGGMCVYHVDDDGIGVPAEFHEKVFGVFQRLHTEQEYPGTGIGLSICKRIVERHGGTIRIVDREGEDGQDGPGTRFVVSIPISGGPAEVHG